MGELNEEGPGSKATNLEYNMRRKRGEGGSIQPLEIPRTKKCEVQGGRGGGTRKRGQEQPNEGNSDSKATNIK